MSDRLAELRRQRALVQEHLAWLEREIEAETRKSAEPQGPDAPGGHVAGNGLEFLAVRQTASFPAMPTATAPVHMLGTDATPPPHSAGVLKPASTASAPSTATPADPGADPDAILEQYRRASELLRTDVRKGCFLYFAAAFALLIVTVAVLYFVLSRR